MKPLIFFLLGLLFFVSIEQSYAQTYSSSLILDPIQSQINSGSKIIFSGQLITSDGQYVIPDRTIYIKDDVDFGTDTIIGSVVTDGNGEFSGGWIAVPRDSGSYDFYAVFEGDSDVQYARSKTFSVYVNQESNSVNSGSSKSNSNSNQQYQNYYETKITLNKIQSSIFAGESITFTGKLYSNGNPVSNAVVNIKEDDPLSPDQLLSSGRTDSSGSFSIYWQASKGFVETDFDIYAIFDGDSNYLKARSNNQILSVLRHTGSITLDAIPKSANIGDRITFSGTLELNQGSSEGAVVYIKDEDPLNRDDLLATAYVDRNGRFSASWLVADVDIDSEADIYAIFEGNDVYYKLTTCDLGATRDFGNSCIYTIPLMIYYPKSISTQQNLGTSNQQYMELFYSLDFTKNPRVAIVPSPDDYAEAKKYIIPAQEGIQMWKTYLSNKYGGNWNVDFEIITPDKLFFENKPDIIMNLVTPEQDYGCNYDYYGVAYTSTNKPVQTSVCISSNDVKHSSEQVSATSAHEFIHAVGLGHAWNKDGDLMCSVEDGKETCNTQNKAKKPSDLNLVGVVNLYDLDGFKNPNIKVSSGKKISLDSYADKKSTASNNNQKSDLSNVKPTQTEKQFDYKKETLKIQKNTDQKINSLKSGISSAEKSLKSTNYKKSEAKEEVKKAWTAMWWAKKHLGNADETQKEGMTFISKSDFKSAYYKYKYSFDSAKKIEPYLFDITKYLNNAKKLEK